MQNITRLCRSRARQFRSIWSTFEAEFGSKTFARENETKIFFFCRSEKPSNRCNKRSRRNFLASAKKKLKTKKNSFAGNVVTKKKVLKNLNFCNERSKKSSRKRNVSYSWVVDMGTQVFLGTNLALVKILRTGVNVIKYRRKLFYIRFLNLNYLDSYDMFK